jgi:hypothetical protein
MDEELMTIVASLCRFLMHEYILPHGAYHTPGGHMAQFPMLYDYIEQGQVDQLESHRKFKELCGCV